MGDNIHYQDFALTFLPHAASIDNAATQSYLMPPRIIKLIEKATSGRQIADAWKKWLNPGRTSAAASPCPAYCLELFQDKSVAKKNKHRLNIDAALYKKDELSIDGYPRWETSRLLIKFKCGDEEINTSDDEAGDDAFDTPTDVRGQIAPHVAKAFCQQHRVAMFFLLVDGNKLQIARWGRSGIYFTKKFDYTEQLERLRNVLMAFSQLRDGEQGFDTTATLLTPDHPYYELMHSLTHDKDTDISEVEGTVVPDKQDNYTFRFVRKAFAKSIENDAPRYILTVPGAQGEREFLVGKATFVAPGANGRGTRGYVAWDITGERFTFLKDAWRRDFEDVSTEGRVPQDLRSAGVENIPTYVCDGELASVTETPSVSKSRGESGGPSVSRNAQSQSSGVQAGLKRKKNASTPHFNASTSIGVSQAKQIPAANATNNYQGISSKVCRKKKSVDRRFRRYRVVVEEVCLPLKSFKTGKQLISILRDCVKAHEGASTEAKLLHCDISTGSILICPKVEADEQGVLRVKWRGVLADWELSKPLPDGTETAAHQGSYVRGSWQFASAHILDNPEQPVGIPDEIESFFHVALHIALRYIRNDYGNTEAIMFDFFDDYAIRGDRYYLCGTVKRATMNTGTLNNIAPGIRRINFLGDDGESDSQPLNMVFHMMLEWFKARYQMLAAMCLEKDPARLARIQQVEEFVARFRDRHVPERSAQQQKPPATPPPIDDHNELLFLFDVALTFDWPERDLVDDQTQKPGTDSKGDSNDGAGEDEPDSDPDEPSAKRRRTRSCTNHKGKGRDHGEKPETIDMEPQDASEHRRWHSHRAPVHTRGCRRMLRFGRR